MNILGGLWLAVKASRRLQIILAAFVGYLGWHGWLAMHDKSVRKEVTVAIDTKHKETAAKAGEARAKAHVPGAADRLRQRYCEGACK